MDTGFFCPECLSPCAWISTTNEDRYWCTKCDVRYNCRVALDFEEVKEEMFLRVENWEEPKYWDYSCPNCKSTQRIALDTTVITGHSEHPICLNCREKLVVRVPYSAFVK